MSGYTGISPYGGDVNLKEFLESEDLDDAVHLSQNVLLSEENQKAIRNVIQDYWYSKPQAVSNLLQNAWIIPEDIRLETLYKGLKEDKQRYFVLAAAVGTQSLPNNLVDMQMIDVLIGSVANNDGPIAARAFTSLEEKLKHPRDTVRVIPFLKHPDGTVRHNTRAWIIRHAASDTQDSIANLFREAKRDDMFPLFMRVMKKHKESSETWSSFDKSWLAYIPNMCEVDSMEKQRIMTKDLFLKLDKDSDGFIGAVEVKQFLDAIGQTTTLERAASMVASQDEDEDGKIDQTEWFQMMRGKLRFT